MYSDRGRGRGGFGSRGRGRSRGFGRGSDDENRERHSGYRDSDSNDWRSGSRGQRDDYDDGENRYRGERSRGSGRRGFREDRGQNFGNRRFTEHDDRDGTSFYVAKNKVGLIIGKGGSKIRELEEDSGCKIKIQEGRSDWERTIFLRGSDEAQRIAKQLIEDLTRDDNQQRRGGDRFQQGRDDDWENDGVRASRGSGANRTDWGDTEVEEEFFMEIPRNKVGRVIGRGGTKVRELREQSGCNININNNEVELRGSSNAVSTARRMIEEILEDDFGRNDSDFSRNRDRQFGDRNQYDGAVTRIEVESNKLGKIIGRGGSKIRELQQDSGARIKIVNDEASAFTTPIDLRGSDDQREEAKRLIEELTADEEIVCM